MDYFKTINYFFTITYIPTEGCLENLRTFRTPLVVLLRDGLARKAPEIRSENQKMSKSRARVIFFFYLSYLNWGNVYLPLLTFGNIFCRRPLLR